MTIVKQLYEMTGGIPWNNLKLANFVLWIVPAFQYWTPLIYQDRTQCHQWLAGLAKPWKNQPPTPTGSMSWTCWVKCLISFITGTPHLFLRHVWINSENHRETVIYHLNPNGYFVGAKTAFWALTDYRAVNVKDKLLSFANYDTLDWEECCAFMSTEYLQMFFKISEKLQKCHFTDEERCLFQAITILQPGRLFKSLHNQNHMTT